ncbi:MAG: hypothetical protein RLZZ458_2808 [Planctomycetota bacterium]|jgi:hypothetical protein
MVLFVLESLPATVQVENALLLAAAVSRKYPLNKAASRVRGRIWNFFSPLDMPTTGLGTAVFGTMDRRHAVSAGCLGFSTHTQSPSQLQQVCFQPQMVRHWNLGGHFGWTNSLFVRNQLAPLLKIHPQPVWINCNPTGRDSNERQSDRKNPRPYAVSQ